MSTENTLLYFAYGSNLRTRRLAARTGEAVPRGRATLPGHVLRFHKVSTDGTGKANAHATGQPGDRVIGALFEVTAEGRTELDDSEGGYRRVVVRVEREDGTTVDAFTYLAKPGRIDDGLRPSADYRETVIDGALEQGLPADYIDRVLRLVPVVHLDEKIQAPRRARAQGGKL